jgi:hypothetical protein
MPIFDPMGLFAPVQLRVRHLGKKRKRVGAPCLGMQARIKARRVKGATRRDKKYKNKELAFRTVL